MVVRFAFPSWVDLRAESIWPAFDMGVFEEAGTVMVVNRGLSGREPIRFRCNPQVMRRDAEGSGHAINWRQDLHPFVRRQ